MVAGYFALRAIRVHASNSWLIFSFFVCFVCFVVKSSHPPFRPSVVKIRSKLVISGFRGISVVVFRVLGTAVVSLERGQNGALF